MISFPTTHHLRDKKKCENFHLNNNKTYEFVHNKDALNAHQQVFSGVYFIFRFLI